jgi:class 3 adenylate cyclase
MVLFADVDGSMDLAEQVDPEQWGAGAPRLARVARFSCA